MGKNEHIGIVEITRGLFDARMDNNGYKKLAPEIANILKAILDRKNKNLASR